MKTPTPPSSETMTLERQAFEEWAKSYHEYVGRMHDGDYEMPETQMQWDAWKASAERREREGYRWVPVEPTQDMLDAVDCEVGGSCYSCSKQMASDEDSRNVWKLMLAAAPDGETK